MMKKICYHKSKCGYIISYKYQNVDMNNKLMDYCFVIIKEKNLLINKKIIKFNRHGKIKYVFNKDYHRWFE